MDIGKIIRKARLDRGATMKTVEAATGILASNQSKIELGENTAPGFDTVARLADYYGLSLDGIYEATRSDIDSPVLAAQAKISAQLPVISWVQAGCWAESLPQLDENTPVISSPFRCSDKAYVLEVNGDSMTSQHGAMESFPEGTLIVVDPLAEVRNKSYVVARVNGTDNTTFKQMIFDGSAKFLKPINPQYPIIPIDKPIDICGVVIGKIQKVID